MISNVCFQSRPKMHWALWLSSIDFILHARAFAFQSIVTVGICTHVLYIWTHRSSLVSGRSTDSLHALLSNNRFSSIVKSQGVKQLRICYANDLEGMDYGMWALKWLIVRMGLSARFPTSLHDIFIWHTHNNDRLVSAITLDVALTT